MGPEQHANTSNSETDSPRGSNNGLGALQQRTRRGGAQAAHQQGGSARGGEGGRPQGGGQGGGGGGAGSGFFSPTGPMSGSVMVPGTSGGGPAGAQQLVPVAGGPEGAMQVPYGQVRMGAEHHAAAQHRWAGLAWSLHCHACAVSWFM